MYQNYPLANICLLLFIFLLGHAPCIQSSREGPRPRGAALETHPALQEEKGRTPRSYTSAT